MTEEILKAAAKEHGHECPGLALGLRVSEIASEVFGWEKIPEDLTVTADRPACYVDGIRFMTGCSPANGRISFRNDGKWAFVFSSRGRKISVELKSRPNFAAGRDAMMESVLFGDRDELFNISDLV